MKHFLHFQQIPLLCRVGSAPSDKLNCITAASPAAVFFNAQSTKNALTVVKSSEKKPRYVYVF
ncbi:hypothetical protein, partial [Treponema endosymbiont of Eucomonympha sp.]|uniref:hypothetical protein n=1 Tax=Treponema endosymbiont of Eucomonympha sp. TaxID=1580831 RepID=UPI001EE7437C